MPGKRWPTLVSILIATAVMLLSGPMDALAHKVYVFAWVEGDKVITDSYFTQSSKVKGGRITVFGPAGEKLLDGTTDDNGAFSFKAPQKTDLRIVVEAGQGHRGEFTLSAGEFAGTAPAPTPMAGNPPPEAAAAKPHVSNNSAGPPDSAEIKHIVEEALDARLAPLIRGIAKLKEDRGPGFVEIIGGLGYIFGIMGLVIYLRNRKGQAKDRCT